MPKKAKKSKLVKKLQRAIVAVVDSPPPPQEIMDLVRDPQVDPAKLKALLDMRHEQRMQAAKDAYTADMAEAQAAMEPVRKDCENKQTHSKYASYTTLNRAIRPYYVKKFALEFNTEPMSASDVMRVVCDVSHVAGHTKHFQIDMPIVTKGPQGGDVMTGTHAAMSALTYGKRGLLKSIFNITEVGEDDDGNAAGTVKITEKQLRTLQAKIEELGANTEKICAFAGIIALEDMPASVLGKVMIAIADWERIKKAEAAAEKTKQPA